MDPFTSPHPLQSLYTTTPIWRKWLWMLRGAFFLFNRFAPAGSLCLRQCVESGKAIQTWVYRGDTIYLTEDQCVSQPSSEKLLFTVDGDQHRDP